MTIIRTYSELISLPTFEERFEYLRLAGRVGQDTFGFDRCMNQMFYQRSQEWKRIRDYVIVRDTGCDLAMEGHEIYGKILVHHMNPLVVDDIIHSTDNLLDPEFLICTSLETHNAIHYGDITKLAIAPVVRKKNDTCPWKRG